LFAPTWHYGNVLAHWGDDADLFERFFEYCQRRDVNVILRLHDSYRFSKPYIRSIRESARNRDNVILKFKDQAPDNFLDLQVADILITNYSSIANLFYATLRPSIHIYPVRSEDEKFMWRTYSRFGGVATREVESVRHVWKIPPEVHGGLLVRNFDGLIEALDRSLEEPDCCGTRSRRFLDEHMLGADGKACERALGALREISNV
jgi:CDP-glycerol glycerophosphotransferase (TagB/SpsB family)